MKSQEDMILEYLKTGNSITPLDALERFRCFRLGARCFDLRAKGYPIQSEIIHSEGKHFSRYWLGQPGKEPQAKAETAQGGEITPKVGIITKPSTQKPRQAFETAEGQYAFI